MKFVDFVQKCKLMLSIELLPYLQAREIIVFVSLCQKTRNVDFKYWVSLQKHLNRDLKKNFEARNDINAFIELFCKTKFENFVIKDHHLNFVIDRDNYFDQITNGIDTRQKFLNAKIEFAAGGRCFIRQS